MLLGPLGEAEWDGFFDGALHGRRGGYWGKVA